jgi:hypothetical protein
MGHRNFHFFFELPGADSILFLEAILVFFFEFIFCSSNCVSVIIST